MTAKSVVFAQNTAIKHPTIVPPPKKISHCTFDFNDQNAAISDEYSDNRVQYMSKRKPMHRVNNEKYRQTKLYSRIESVTANVAIFKQNTEYYKHGIQTVANQVERVGG